MPRGRIAKTDRKMLMIGTKYRIYSDRLQWILEGLKKLDDPKAKQEYRWILVGYYPRLKDVYESLLEHKIKTADLEDFHQIAQLVEDAKKEISQAVEVDETPEEITDEQGEENDVSEDSELSEIEQAG